MPQKASQRRLRVSEDWKERQIELLLETCREGGCGPSISRMDSPAAAASKSCVSAHPGGQCSSRGCDLVVSRSDTDDLSSICWVTMVVALELSVGRPGTGKEVRAVCVRTPGRA